ncbi:MAG: hypothetical protein K6E16_11635 [Lachnospiraceae bacterium]|nr:hypothetical protein [Lachnospiraceae bacterium]
MNKTRNLVTGLLLIALAACLILWKLNVFSLPVAVAGVSTWGLIVSVIMVIVIIHSILDLRFSGIFIPLAVIGIIFDEPLGITAITPWVILIAALLLTVAFDMIFSKNRRYHRHHDRGFRSDRPAESYDEDENGYIVHSLKFGSAAKYVRTQELTGADLSTQFGEMSVYFDGAEVPSGNVNINCRVAFGEMDVYIPKNWTVENRVSVTLGDCDDRCTGSNHSEGGSNVTCRIDGSVSFGELKLIRI